MPDIATIGAALSSIKTATDIAKFLRASDLDFEKAELKLKMADLIVALADAKIELVDVQELLVEKDKQLAELNEAFESKDELIRFRDAYYKLDESGEAIGVPFCLRCWENDHKKRQLVNDPQARAGRICTSCKHKYEGRLTSEIFPNPK
ncbi:hypothetical protein LNL84_07820 [Vibrio sp. ZSDZ34]|uniref:Uncharacterized protein n=1 Tax=Vibrio gelatinilyticus TaxID=2893468 RepID=A0A9X1W9B6_9VIBR|nr:hypothetical protein [Vibrio gelatinilyticus]MCJ2376742.1 hypothetical protein [Vibrio gelatinilyticus]